MGPDEYHTGYASSDRPGIDNNAYTNLMAVWVLCRGLEVLDVLPRDRRHELCEKLGLEESEIATWDAISRKMRLVFLEGGVLAQFEGYDRLSELDHAATGRGYGDIHRLDLILGGRGDSQNLLLSKQADG
jgi:trehalose/maltose hydrolase-like predicted phosphorylase